MLDVSSRTIERWEGASVAPGTPEAVRRYALLSEIVDLAEEVHGGEVERFMATPRRSLGMRTPREAMARGDLDDVRQILIDALEGHWA